MTTRTKIHPKTKIGTVSLNIRNMERSLRFYVDLLGLQVREQGDNVAYLGAGAEDILILHENPSAPPIEDKAGLYHFAILVPNRVELAKVLYRLLNTKTPMHGFSDHLVSEAIYLPDPDDIGIEIYRDRPREEWKYQGDQVVMGGEQLDIEGILAELTPQNSQWTGMHPNTRMGHVHIHTGRNFAKTQHFYTDMLGFDMMANMGGYWFFVAAGGYHHHIGLRPSDTRKNQASIGLDWYALDFPDDSARLDTVNQLQAENVDVQKRDEDYFFYDHAGNGIVLRVN